MGESNLQTAREPRPRPQIRTTHTYVELELSPAAYDEIRTKLTDAGYQHTFMQDGAIDLSGIAVTRGETPDTERHDLTRAHPDGHAKPRNGWG